MIQIPDIKRSYTGLTEVTSRSGLGKGQTKFYISIKDGSLSIPKHKNSMAPAFKDVWRALESLFQELGLEIPKDDPKGIVRDQTSHGAYYVGIGNQFIGRSTNDKFSLRGDNELPAELVLKLLYPLDTYLAEKGL